MIYNINKGESYSYVMGCVYELTDSQEKELHKLGRKIRKKFNMKPVKL